MDKTLFVKATLQAIIGGKVDPDLLFIRIAGVVIMDWLIWVIKNIIEFNMERMDSLRGKVILMGLNPSGLLQKEGL